jgi:hypothetical protein
MPLFQDADADAIVEQFRRQHDVLARALGYTTAPRADAADEASAGTLHRDVLRLIGVANGVYDRTDTNVRRAELALERVLALVQSSGAHGAPVALPDAFWESTLGVLVARTRWWVSADEIITISNAAALAFGDNTQANRMRITRAVERGELDWVPDPSVANPQHNKRVLRDQVERLGASRRPAAFRGTKRT